jgi:hypothetical protein
MKKGTHLICVASVPQLIVQEQERTSAKFWNSAPTHTANHTLLHTTQVPQGLIDIKSGFYCTPHRKNQKSFL